MLESLTIRAETLLLLCYFRAETAVRKTFISALPAVWSQNYVYSHLSHFHDIL